MYNVTGNITTASISEILETDPFLITTTGSHTAVFGPFPAKGFEIITAFTPLIHGTYVHHMIVYSSSVLSYKEKTWRNRCNGCTPVNGIIFSWSKSEDENDPENNAPSTFLLPEGTGIILATSSITDRLHSSIFIECHFELPSGSIGKLAIGPGLRITKILNSTIHLQQSSSKNAVVAVTRGASSTAKETSALSSTLHQWLPIGVGVAYSSNFRLPKYKADTRVNVLCTVKKDIEVVAFRNHAHSAGRLLESVLYRNGLNLGILASRSAKKAQRFVGIPSRRLKANDKVLLTCHYNTKNRSFETKIGASPTRQEMCNQYYMYFPYSLSEKWGDCKSVYEEPVLERKYRPVPFIPFANSLNGSKNPLLPKGIFSHLNSVATSSDGSLLFLLSRQLNANKGLIDEPVIFVLNVSANGALVKSFGSNIFMEPRSIYVDDWNCLWITDVALHQVFRLNPFNGTVELVVGQEGVSGRDESHFSQPSDVVVSLPDAGSEPEVFVSDGYGNGRVVVLNYKGHFIREWEVNSAGTEQFQIPHSIEVDSFGRVYVADRENGSTKIYYKNGTYIDQWQGSFKSDSNLDDSSNLSALAYSFNLELMFSLEGSKIVIRDVGIGRNWAVVTSWNVVSKSLPQDLAIGRKAKTSSSIYVSESKGMLTQYVLE